MRSLPRDWRPMSRVFSALGDEHRQRILLLFEPGERLNVSQIVEASPLSRSAVSHHLKILRDANVLLAEKLGREIYLRINKPFLDEVLGNVLGYIRSNV